MKKLSVVLGLSLLLAACGASEEEAKENSGSSNSGETNSGEMNEGNSGSMNDSDAKKSEDEQSSDGEEESNATDSLMVEIMEKEKEDEGHHASDVHIMLEKDSDNPKVLTAKVKNGDSAIEGASVRFEYWKEGEEKHIYTDAEEVGTGEYQAKTEIMDAGTYNMKVHVEKGEDLHTHKPYTLNVTMEKSS